MSDDELWMPKCEDIDKVVMKDGTVVRPFLFRWKMYEVWQWAENEEKAGDILRKKLKGGTITLVRS